MIMHWWNSTFPSKSHSDDDASSRCPSKTRFFASLRSRRHRHRHHLAKVRQVSDNDVHNSPATSCPSSPQPLPLPDSPALLQRKPISSSGGVLLPPPAKIQIKRGGEEKGRERESNVRVNVHPLPLPPGAAAVAMSLYSNTASPLGCKSDSSGASIPSHASPISSQKVKPDQIPIAKITSQVSPVKSLWQKGKLLGRGTFGSVYVASNRETGALCAMKEVEILPDDSKSAECLRQLQQEIKVLSQLKHPNIVQYYGSEIIGDKFYIYLEYVHPGSINKFIHDHCGAITESVVRNFTRHILCGLAYLHGTKTIHRDIKGANLLVDANGVVKLADFGMSKHLHGQTAILSLKGSPHWLAPELLQSSMQTEAGSYVAFGVDVWSLGCTIIEMMNGKPPWSEYEGPAALFKVLKGTPVIPETMSAEGKDFLQSCFQRNPADRPTARQLLEHAFLSSHSPLW